MTDHTFLTFYACKNPECPLVGVTDAGNLRVHSTSGLNHDSVIIACKACGRRASETRDSPFWRSRISKDRANEILAEFERGQTIRGIARRFRVARNTARRYHRLGLFFKLS